jgi:hypothetical protein
VKRRIKAFICAAVLLLTLPSCAGIGDGALIGDVYLNGERIVCTVEAYTFDHELRDSFRMDGAPANELFAYMTGYEYDNRVLEGDYMMAQYVTVTFERYNLKGEKLSDVDPKSGLKYQYRVFVDDETMQKLSDGEGYQTLGYPDGMYERIVGYFAVRSSSNGYFCSISPVKSPHANINVPAQAGYKMYKSLTEGEYGNNFSGLQLVKPGCYIIDFGGASNKCYYIFENDSVCEYELSIDSNNVDPMKPLGTLNGIYKQAEELFILSLENQSNLDTEAGMKLNCIQVNTKPGEYSADDFAEVGCLYLDKIDENSYIVYFPRMLKYEFDQCLELLKAREDLIEVSPIFIIEMY